MERDPKSARSKCKFTPLTNAFDAHFVNDLSPWGRPLLDPEACLSGARRTTKWATEEMRPHRAISRHPPLFRAGKSDEPNPTHG